MKLRVVKVMEEKMGLNMADTQTMLGAGLGLPWTRDMGLSIDDWKKLTGWTTWTLLLLFPKIDLQYQ